MVALSSVTATSHIMLIGGLYKIVTPSSPLSPYLLLAIRWVLLLCYLVQQVVPGRQQYCAVIALSLLIKT